MFNLSEVLISLNQD